MERRIAEGVFWVGVYLPKKSLSLNAYLLKDEKNALIDTTASSTANEVLTNIRGLADPAEIDYIILTHTDVDHAGGMQTIWSAAKDAEVITSSNYGKEMISLLGLGNKTRVLTEGEVIDLGKKKLRMVPAPFLCMPDSAFIYDETDKILFTADAFGTFTKEWKLFGEDDLEEQMKFYNEIKFGHRINVATGAINVRKKNLDVEIICPGHGSMVRDAAKYIEKAILMML